MRIAAALLPALVLAGCANTGPVGGPAEVIRYHLDQPLGRGTVIIQPADNVAALSTEPYAAAVSRALNNVGYVQAAPGGGVDYIAVIDVRRRAYEGAPRRSGLSIGIGAGGFSGGRHGGFGVGGGVGFPVGGGRRAAQDGVELSVTIKRRVDQSPIWEGHARAVAARNAPEADTAEKLARALFTGFPGESGRTIEVR